MFVAQGGGGGPWEAVGVTTNEYKVSFWCNENIKVSVVIGAQFDD